jgi:hypothetical protein
MRPPRLTYANVTATLALFLALGGGAWAVGTTRSARVIHACYAGKSGALHVSASGRCRHGQHALSWNRTGPAGQPGASGQPGPAGQPGAPGQPGAGQAFDVFFANPASPKTVSTSATTILSQPSLPAGAYAISANVALDNHTDTNATAVTCTLTAGGDSASAQAILVAGDGLISIPLSLTHTFTAPGSVTLQCNKSSAHTALVDDADLSATQLSAQTRMQQG